MSENSKNKPFTKQLDKTTLALANANVELLAAQEELEAKNKQLEILLSELANSKDELQAILDVSNSAIVMVNPLGIITAGNQQIISYFQPEQKELLGTLFNDFIDNIKDRFAEPGNFVAKIKQLDQQPEKYKPDDIYVNALQTKGPDLRFIALVAETVTNKKKNITLGRAWVFYDITEIKAADEKLRAIVEASPVPYIISRAEDGKILYVNDALAKLSGLDEKELLQKTTPYFYYDTAERERIIAELKSKGYIFNQEIKLKRSDGHYGWMIMSIVKSNIRNDSVFITSLYDIDQRRKAEEALQKERNFISAILDTAPALVLVLDTSGTVVRMNRSCEIHAGTSLAKHENIKFWELIDQPDEATEINSNFEKLLSGQSDETIECYWTDHIGDKRLFTWSTSMLHDENGQIEFVIVIGTDITNRKAAEEKLSLYREIFLNSNDAIAVVNSEGKIVERNPAHIEKTGISDAVINNMTISDFIKKECTPNIINSLEKSGNYRGEAKAISKDGGSTDVDLSIFTINNPNNEPKYYVGIARDITERIKAEKALQTAKDELEERVLYRTRQLEQANTSLIAEINERKQAEEAYGKSSEQVQAFLEAIPDLIFRLSRSGHYLDYHAPKNSKLEIPADHVIGKHISEIFPPELLIDAEKTITKALSTGDIQIWEYQLPHHDKTCDFEARIIVSGKDEVLAIVRDITSQKQARVQLQKAKDMLEQRVKERTKALAKTNEALLEEISDRIQAEQNLEKRLRYEEGLAICSQALLKHSDLETALSHALTGLLEASGTSRAYLFKNILHKEKIYLNYIFHKSIQKMPDQQHDKRIKQIGKSPQFIRWVRELSQGKPIHGLIKDFPQQERVILESLQMESLLVLPIFIENNWWGIIGFEDVEKERIWTEKDIRLLKLAAEMIGGYIDKKNAEDALMVSEKRYRTLVENAHDIIFSMSPEGTFTYISPQFKVSTGYRVNEFIGKSLESLIHPDDLQEFKQTIATDKSQEYSYRIKHKNGEWRWFISHTTVLYDENNNMIDRIGIAHDVTDLKIVMNNLEKTNQELHKTQAQLVQSEKMGALGMLVAGIAHEINTPVGAIYSMHNTLVRAVSRLNKELSEKYPQLGKENAEIQKSLSIINDANRVIESGTDRVTSIVKRLRSFARLDEAELKDANIHDGIEDTLVIIHHEIKHDINIVRDFGELPIISCFPGRLNQVFLNLLINARQAIAGKGEIRIKTFQQNNHIAIQIIDNGKGIEKKNLDKIFDPGFTTKGVGVGTGLGLSICYQIIQDHHGTISVESESGKGTTFTITLPINLDQILNETKTG